MHWRLQTAREKEMYVNSREQTGRVRQSTRRQTTEAEDGATERAGRD